MQVLRLSLQRSETFDISHLFYRQQSLGYQSSNRYIIILPVTSFLLSRRRDAKHKNHD